MRAIVEILIDNSNSMGPFQVEKNNGEYLLPDGSTRMELAKKILSEDIIPILTYASKVVARKFHSIGEEYNNLYSEEIYDGIFDLENLTNSISQIEIPENTGGTPISAALEQSIKELSKKLF